MFWQFRDACCEVLADWLTFARLGLSEKLVKVLQDTREAYIKDAEVLSIESDLEKCENEQQTLAGPTDQTFLDIISY
eukprot:3340019-Amphidinium_carterae.2